jgi:hypothetical protein
MALKTKPLPGVGKGFTEELLRHVRFARHEDFFILGLGFRKNDTALEGKKSRSKGLNTLIPRPPALKKKSGKRETGDGNHENVSCHPP